MEWWLYFVFYAWLPSLALAYWAGRKHFRLTWQQKGTQDE